MPLGLKPAVGEAPERDRHRRGEVEHVDRAAAPHEAVDDLGAERVARPAVGVHGHDVGVAHEQQARRVRVGALDPRDQARAPGLRLVALDVEAGAAEVLREQVDAADLVARRERAVVHALRCGSGPAGVSCRLRRRVVRASGCTDADRWSAPLGAASVRLDAVEQACRPRPSARRRRASTRCSRWANVSLSAMTPQCCSGKISCDSCCDRRGPERERRRRGAAPCARRGAP